MQTSQLTQRCATGIALLLTVAQAGAWTPSAEPLLMDGAPLRGHAYAPGPGMSYPAPPLDYGDPGYQTTWPPTPPMDYPPQGSAPMPPQPEVAPAPMPDPYPMPERLQQRMTRGAADSVMFAGMRLTQHRSDEAYTLDIELNGLDPAQVQVMPAGSGLVIIAEQSAQTDRTETFADGRGFRRSYSWSGGSQMKRLRVPPDGDLNAMLREDGDGGILIVIPRLAAASGAPEQQPGQQPGQQPSQQPGQQPAQTPEQQ